MSSKEVHEHTLKNGFKILVKEDHRSPIAVFLIIYKVGSGFESQGLTGVSHALEHMMFRGSKNYNIKKFLHMISQNGGYQNAFTSLDCTGYYQIINSALLSESFKFEADRMENLLLRPKDFQKEIQIVMEERRSHVENDPQKLTLERFTAAAYVSSPYHHPTIGWMNDLNNMTVNDLRYWYETWYTPNNALCIVVGDVNSKKIYKLAQKYFGQIKSARLPVIKQQSEVDSIGMRSILVKAKTGSPWLILGFNAPTLITANQTWKPYALLVLGEILAGGDNSRLQRNMVYKNHIASKIGYSYSPTQRISSVIAFYITPSIGCEIETIREALQLEIITLQKEGPHTHELDTVKTQAIASRIYQSDSILNQAQEIGEFETLGLSWREINKSYKQIAKITSVQVQQVACEFLTNDRLIMAELQSLKTQ